MPMSDMTLTKVLRTTGLAERATVHGFRSTFRDWAAECTNAPHAVMELSLAHAVGSSVEQAYARSDLIAKRRALMEQWGSFVTGESPGIGAAGWVNYRCCSPCRSTPAAISAWASSLSLNSASTPGSVISPSDGPTCRFTTPTEGSAYSMTTVSPLRVIRT